MSKTGRGETLRVRSSDDRGVVYRWERDFVRRLVSRLKALGSKRLLPGRGGKENRVL